MTIAEFCASEGLKTTTYQYWQRELKRRDAESASCEVDSMPEAAFAPVQLVDDRDPAASVEIVASNGYVIRVGEGATSEQLRRVLQAMNDLD